MKKNSFKGTFGKGFQIMETRNVIWTPTVREKLIEFRSSRFTPEKTLDFISQLVLETEDL